MIEADNRYLYLFATPLEEIKTELQLLAKKYNLISKLEKHQNLAQECIINNVNYCKEQNLSVPDAFFFLLKKIEEAISKDLNTNNKQDFDEWIFWVHKYALVKYLNLTFKLPSREDFLDFEDKHKLAERIAEIAPTTIRNDWAIQTDHPQNFPNILVVPFHIDRIFLVYAEIASNAMELHKPRALEQFTKIVSKERALEFLEADDRVREMIEQFMDFFFNYFRLFLNKKLGQVVSEMMFYQHSRTTILTDRERQTRQIKDFDLLLKNYKADMEVLFKSDIKTGKEKGTDQWGNALSLMNAINQIAKKLHRDGKEPTKTAVAMAMCPEKNKEDALKMLRRWLKNWQLEHTLWKTLTKVEDDPK